MRRKNESANAWVKRMRLERGLSVTEAAVASGLNVGTWSQIENGLRVNVAAGVKLSRFFGVPIEDLCAEAAGVVTREMVGTGTD